MHALTGKLNQSVDAARPAPVPAPPWCGRCSAALLLLRCTAQLWPAPAFSRACGRSAGPGRPASGQAKAPSSMEAVLAGSWGAIHGPDVGHPGPAERPQARENAGAGHYGAVRRSSAAEHRLQAAKEVTRVWDLDKELDSQLSVGDWQSGPSCSGPLPACTAGGVQAQHTGSRSMHMHAHQEATVWSRCDGGCTKGSNTPSPWHLGNPALASALTHLHADSCVSRRGQRRANGASHSVSPACSACCSAAMSP
jgi:hypothetical protein